MSWSLLDEPVEAGLPVAVNAPFRAEASIGEGLVGYRIHTTVTGTLPDGRELFQLGATYELIFAVPQDSDVSVDEVTDFGNNAALFMAFPYFRELLSSTSSHAGLANILLQPLRLPYVPIVSPQDPPDSGE